MRSKGIPENIRKQSDEIVARFNRANFQDAGCYYETRYKGKYLYLDRNDFGNKGPICRLKYNGKIDNWDFAIFKYSSERYSPDECFFPGEYHVDGTIEGAMRAGMEAYPA